MIFIITIILYTHFYLYIYQEPIYKNGHWIQWAARAWCWGAIAQTGAAGHVSWESNI